MNIYLRHLAVTLSVLAAVHLFTTQIWAADMALSQPFSAAAYRTEQHKQVDEFELTYDSVIGLDLRTMVEVSAKQLDSALFHLLKGKGAEFIQKSEEHQINVYFVCAVAAVESGWGRDYLATEQNNYFGVTRGGSYATYDEFEDSLETFCNLIDKSYLSTEGSYYRGSTVAQVAQNYNKSYQEKWTTLIQEVMVQIYQRTLEYKEEI